MTPFKHAMAICGLSQKEAAEYLGVRLDTVKSWSADRNPVPEGVWSQLGELYRSIQTCADEVLDLIEEQQPDDIEISYSGEQGRFPSLGCALTVEAMIKLQM